LNLFSIKSFFRGFPIIKTRLVHILSRIRNFYYNSGFNFDPLVTYGIIVFVSLVITFSLRIVRLELFIGAANDTAFYLQGLWRLSQFDVPISTFNFLYPSTKSATNILFGGHFMYSALMYIPLFWISDSPLFVGMFIIPFITLGMTLYWWCRLFPGKDNLLWGVLGLVLLIWSPFSGIADEEFYFDTFSVPWVLASLLFLREKREIPFLISLFIVVGFKLYFASFAALACFLYYAENRSKKAVWAGLLFIIYFLFILIVAIPHFFNSESAVKENLGVMDIEGSFAWLAYLFERSFSLENLKYLFNFFGVFLFIPLITPRITFLALPILGIIWLFFSDAIFSGPHYHVLPNTILAVAFVDGCVCIKESIKLWNKRFVELFALVMILAMVCYYGYIPSHLSNELSTVSLGLVPEPKGVRNYLYRLKEDLSDLRSQPAYMQEVKDALSKIQPEEEISIVPKLTPYVVKNSGWVFPKPFNQKNLGNRVNRVIISKHHYSYLNSFRGNKQEFSKYIEFLKEEYNMKVETESVNLIVLTK
jgi:hypothetical protein